MMRISPDHIEVKGLPGGDLLANKEASPDSIESISSDRWASTQPKPCLNFEHVHHLDRACKSRSQNASCEESSRHFKHHVLRSCKLLREKFGVRNHNDVERLVRAFLAP